MLLNHLLDIYIECHGGGGGGKGCVHTCLYLVCSLYFRPTVNPVLCGPKPTPSIKQTPAWLLKFSSHIYCKLNLFSADPSIKRT